MQCTAAGPVQQTSPGGESGARVPGKGMAMCTTAQARGRLPSHDAVTTACCRGTSSRHTAAAQVPKNWAAHQREDAGGAERPGYRTRQQVARGVEDAQQAEHARHNRQLPPAATQPAGCTSLTKASVLRRDGRLVSADGASLNCWLHCRVLCRLQVCTLLFICCVLPVEAPLLR